MLIPGVTYHNSHLKLHNTLYRTLPGVLGIDKRRLLVIRDPKCDTPVINGTPAWCVGRHPQDPDEEVWPVVSTAFQMQAGD